MKWIKRGMIAVIIIGVVIGGAWFYIDRKVSSPEKVVAQFFDAYNNADVNGMLDCMDPAAEEVFSAGADLMGSILGEITGFELDLNALIGLAPVLADTAFDYTEHATVEDIRVVSYTPAYNPEWTEPLINFMPALISILAEEAVVEFRIAEADAIAHLEVFYYQGVGWRIPMDAEIY